MGVVAPVLVLMLQLPCNLASSQKISPLASSDNQLLAVTARWSL
jgi:hypothetical protein